MITSNDNERLKLVRKLRDRKWREREGMFATEGEDLLGAGIDAGWSAGRGARRSRQRHRRRRGRAGSARRGCDARLGYARDRDLADPGRADRRRAGRLSAWGRRSRQRRDDRPDRRRPGRRPAWSSAPAARTPTRRRPCGRAWGRCSRPRRRAGGSRRRPARGSRWSRTGARTSTRQSPGYPGRRRSASGRSATACRRSSSRPAT